MKFKSIYVFLIVIVVFVATVIFFSNRTKQYDASNSQVKNEIPEDNVHNQMKANGTDKTPSKSNVMQDAIDRMNALKAEVEKNPNDTLKIREYADLLTFSHKPAEAVEYYNKVLKVDPKRIDVLLQMTFVYFNMNDFTKAEEYSNKILSFDKNNLAANYNLGAIAASKGDIKKAKIIWQGLATKYPNTEVGKIAAQAYQRIDQIGQK